MRGIKSSVFCFMQRGCGLALGPKPRRYGLARLLGLVAVLGLGACNNSPYPAGAERQNTMFYSFDERSPRYLDPTASYANPESAYTFQIYEPPYRVERMLLQLQQAGVLQGQKAVLLGAFSDWRKSPMDRGYTLKSAVSHLRSVCSTPILTGLPFGHVPTKVMLPVGVRVQLLVQGRDVLIGW